jgi:hypothetical protein
MRETIEKKRTFYGRIADEMAGRKDNTLDAKGNEAM